MHLLKLKEQRHEYNDIYTFIFESETLLLFKAGQYAHILIPSLMWQFHNPARELSFASAPDDNEIWFSVDTRSGSPFKKRMMALVQGDMVRLFGIKGTMVLPQKSHAHVVMIAAGVGITPFRSMLRDIVARELPITATVIHIERKQYLYENELSQMPFEYHRAYRENVEVALADAVQKHPQASYFLAGSPIFVRDFSNKIRTLGITTDKIKSDEFKGLN